MSRKSCLQLAVFLFFREVVHEALALEMPRKRLPARLFLGSGITEAAGGGIAVIVAGTALFGRLLPPLARACHAAADNASWSGESCSLLRLRLASSSSRSGLSILLRSVNSRSN